MCNKCPRTHDKWRAHVRHKLLARTTGYYTSCCVQSRGKRVEKMASSISSLLPRTQLKAQHNYKIVWHRNANSQYDSRTLHCNQNFRLIFLIVIKLFMPIDQQAFVTCHNNVYGIIMVQIQLPRFTVECSSENHFIIYATPHSAEHRRRITIFVHYMNAAARKILYKQLWSYLNLFSMRKLT